MEGRERITHRLFRQDRTTTINTVRGTFAGWSDRLIAAIMLLAAVATIRFWFDDWAWATAAWIACGGAILLGGGAERLIVARLEFHGFDGLLPADALRAPTRRFYGIAWHGVGLVLLMAIALIARPSLLIVSVAGYLAGILAARLTSGLRMPRRVARGTRPRWVVRSWLNDPRAGAAAGVFLLLSLLPARALGSSAQAAVGGIETMLIGLALIAIEDCVVRFMTVAGHGSRRIVARFARSLASFVAVAVPGCWLIMGPVVAGIVAAASCSLLLLLILRVLAYRLHGKRFADFLVSIIAAFLLVAAYAMPVVLPVLAIAIVWHLQRRGTAQAWLLV